MTPSLIPPSQHMAACISGCSNGLVCFWELTSGNCIHEFAEYGNTVIQVACSGDYLLALFSEGCVRVWGVTSGLLIHSIDFVSTGGFMHVVFCVEVLVSLVSRGNLLYNYVFLMHMAYIQ